MRICELVQVGTIEYTEEVVIPATYDEEGNELTPEHVETVTKMRPDMQTVYRDMTPEEEAEALAQQAEAEEMERNRPRTTDERLDAYSAESDDAFFELAEYTASLESQIAELTARVATLEA